MTRCNPSAGVPFLIAGPLAAIALYFRYRIEESPAFSAALKERAKETQTGERSQNLGVAGVIRTQGRFMLPVMGIAAASNVIAYTMTSFTPTYLNQTLGFQGAQGTLVIFPLFILAAFATQFFCIIFGQDRQEAYPVCRLSVGSPSPDTSLHDDGLGQSLGGSAGHSFHHGLRDSLLVELCICSPRAIPDGIEVELAWPGL